MIATSMIAAVKCQVSICHLASASGNANRQTTLALAKTISYRKVTVSYKRSPLGSSRSQASFLLGTEVALGETSP